MRYFVKLSALLLLLTPMLLSSAPYKKPIIMEPIVIQAMACIGDNKPKMTKVYGWEQTYQITSDCRSPSSRSTDIALNTFLFSWKENFGDAQSIVEKNLNDMVIVWSRDPMSMTAYTEKGKLVEDAEVIGVTSNKGYIWVSIRDTGGRICNSSFVHELIHASIWAIRGDHGDPDHLGDVYEGWTDKHSRLIDTLDRKICMLGL